AASTTASDRQPLPRLTAEIRLRPGLGHPRQRVGSRWTHHRHRAHRLPGRTGLDGRLRPVRGVLPAVAAAAEAGVATVVVSAGNAAEAALVPGVEILAADHVCHVAAAFGTAAACPEPTDAAEGLQRVTSADSVCAAEDQSAGHQDLAEVRGQHEARFAL